ncbi:unknown [Clostridium sp. CAG:967]|nr:unknown [Clostridium sp. CAG:967]
MSDVSLTQKFSNMFSKLGAGLTQTAMTGIALKSMNSGCGGNSIWGFGCGGGNIGFAGGYGFGFGGGLCPGADPMGVTWMNSGGCSTNPYAAAMGQQAAYAWGASLYQQAAAQYAVTAQQRALAQSQMQTLQKTKAEYAGNIEKDQSTEQGKAFDKATDEMVDKEGNVVKDKEFSIIDKYTDPEDKTKCKDEYKEAVSNLAKSYAAEIDNSQGNKDGKVTLEEFVKHELSKLPSDASDATKSKAKLAAQNAYNKIDQNGDGYADWKELAAVMATLDTDTSQQKDKDGTIKSSDYAKWSALMSQNNTNEFDYKVRASYTQLFSKDK